jgi:peptide/nickel transport system substrate-binding protein
MFGKGWRLLLPLFFILGCGDKTEVKVTDIKPAASKEAAGKPVTGDWLVMHSLSDPEQLNPLTSNDSASSDVLELIFEGLLSRDPRTLAFKPVIAEARPEISQNHLSYTFKIRKDAHFQDGRPVTGEDILFSVKAIKCPFVNAPFLRVYFNSLIDAELIDPYTIRFLTKEPYFLNESVLGGITVMPRHYYDPENLLARVSVKQLAQDPQKLPPEVKRFGEQFNKNYSRNPMGSGPFKFGSWNTGRELELIRDDNYWGPRQSRDRSGLYRSPEIRIINNPDAALIRLKSGSLDFIEAFAAGAVCTRHRQPKIQARISNYEYYAPTLPTSAGTTSHPIFRDKRVPASDDLFDGPPPDRQIGALSALAKWSTGQIYLFRPEYDKTLVSYPFDPKKAMELLNEAGWRDSDGDGILDKEIDGKRVPLRFEIKGELGQRRAQERCLSPARRTEETWHRRQRARVGLDDLPK